MLLLIGDGYMGREGGWFKWFKRRVLGDGAKVKNQKTVEHKWISSLGYATCQAVAVIRNGSEDEWPID